MGETRPDSPFAEYFGRMRGTTTRTATRQPISDVFLSWASAAIGIVLIAIPSLYVDLPISTRLFLIGSFGASAALLYGAPHSDFAQPRNLIIGPLVAAFVGVTAYKVIGARRPCRGRGRGHNTRDLASHPLLASSGRGDCTHRRTRPRSSAPSRLRLRLHTCSYRIRNSAGGSAGRE
jgi:hypothetical protein